MIHDHLSYTQFSTTLTDTTDVAAGSTHREAAARFGVSAASVSRWRALERRQGDARPGPLGGDRRSGRIEAHGEAILALIDGEPDMTLHEMRKALAARGLQFGIGTLWRFFRRHGVSLKKRPPAHTAGAPAPALPGPASSVRARRLIVRRTRTPARLSL